MEIDFPDTPTVGQVYDQWTWDGELWGLTPPEPPEEVIVPDEVFVGDSEPSLETDLWFDTAEDPGTLKVLVDGAWVDVTTSGSGGGTDEVWIGPDQPVDEALELWYDTDATNQPTSSPSWNSAWGVVAVGTMKTSPVTTTANTYTSLLAAPVTFTTLVGRRYRIHGNSRAVIPNAVNTSTVMAIFHNGAQWTDNHAFPSVPGKNYNNMPITVYVNGDGASHTYDLRAFSEVALTAYTDGVSCFFIIEDVGPTTPDSGVVLTPTMQWNAAWGTVAYVQLTTDLTGTQATPVEILRTPALNLIAGRRYEITAETLLGKNAPDVSATDVVRLVCDTTQIAQRNVEHAAPGSHPFNIGVEYQIAGTHTFAFTLSTTGGFVNVQANPGYPTWLAVRDVGPVTGMAAIVDKPTAQWNSAWGVVARMSSGSVPASEGEINIGTPVAWRSIAGRRYRVSGQALIVGSVPGSTLALRLKNAGGGVVQRKQSPTSPLGHGVGIDVEYLWEGGDVNESWTLHAAVEAGGGTAQVYSDGACHAWLTAEDLGPSAGPVPVSNPTPAWLSVPFSGTWSQYQGYQLAGYRRIGDIVYMRGLVQSTGTDPVICVLPVGYRPTITEICVADSSFGTSGVSRIDIRANGEVVHGSSAAIAYLSLANITFSVTP